MAEHEPQPRGPAPAPDRCPRCGAAFTCGIATGRCWCAALPPLPHLPAWRSSDGQAVAAGCLCPDCLRALVAQVVSRPG